MSALNFRQRIVEIVRANTIGLAQQMVKSVGYTVENTLKTQTNNALTTIEGIPGRVADRIKNIPNDVSNIPVAPGLSLEQFVTSLTNPKDNPTEFNRSIEAFTGVNLNQISNFSLTPIEADIRLDEFAAALRTQVMLEIQNCIELHLNGIVNKNLDLIQILNFEDLIANKIAAIRLDIRFKVQDAIENFFYDKLKIQQVALLKQKILQSIRKICPNHHTSPTTIKRLQSDRTWEVAKSGEDIRVSASSESLTIEALSQQEDNTGQEVIDVANDTVELLKDVAKEQAIGYNDSSPDTFMNNDGTPVAA